MNALVYLLMPFWLLACATPRVQVTSDTTQVPMLTPVDAIMADGYRLPISIWQPAGEPQAIVLGLHGFNDYRLAFAAPAEYLAVNGIMTYAYDQRGFGETEQRGIWPGADVLQQDADTVVQLLCERYPGIPLYLLGESMGGAVAMDLIRDMDTSCLNGIILAAPAVWGWQTMPVLQRSALWLAAHTAPGQVLTGDGLEITPSDNMEMLRALGQDPLVIKATRIDAMFGLTNLMESALLSSRQLTLPALILYGENDDIIPPNSVCEMMKGLLEPQAARWRMVLYPDGYHMLTRDLQAAVVLQDMLSWILDPAASLPSDLEVGTGTPRLRAMCEAT
ncbi:MAG: lysophospholipase [Gammaproteobacteria bacterium]|jgi:alpha-beta hydrolase superfamily lysophospholipase